MFSTGYMEILLTFLLYASENNNKRTITVTVRGPFTVQTDKLSITGKVFKPVDIESERLTITGRDFPPVDIHTEELTITGRVFSPMTLQTEKLTITGKVFNPISIKTQELMITGKAVMTVPLLFDELYILQGKGVNPRREMLIDSLGEYIARSRFKGISGIGAVVQPDIKEFLKKIGLDWEDKDKI